MAQAILQVRLPAGVTPGQTVQVQAPDGQTIQCVVPPGFTGGDISLAYTPRRASSPARQRQPSQERAHRQQPSTDIELQRLNEPAQSERPVYQRPPPRQQAPAQLAMREQQQTHQVRHAKRGEGFKTTKSKPKTCCGCGYVCVQPDELASLERCGAFKGIRKSGCHILGCDWCGKTLQMHSVTTRVQETEVESVTKTKDNVFVHMIVSVQLEVMAERAYDAIYRLDDPLQQIESYVSDVIRGTVPRMTLDDLFASKDDIAGAVKHRLEDCLSNFGYKIHQVLVTDLSPDDRVRNAMNQIDANRRLRVASLEKAEAHKTLVVKAAEADAESAFLQGQGIARQRMAIAEGLKRDVGVGGELDPETTRELLLITQYFDMLDTLSNGKNTTVFMPHSVGNLAQITDEMKQGIFGNDSSKLRQRPQGLAQI